MKATKEIAGKLKENNDDFAQRAREKYHSRFVSVYLNTL